MKRTASADPKMGPGNEDATPTPGPPVKLTKEDVRRLVEVFLILDRWKREDDERAAAEGAK